MSLNALAKVASHLRTSSDDDVLEFAASVERVVSGDETSLDRLLGLRPAPGQRSLETKVAINRRDELLRRTAADHYGDLSAAATADAMHRAWLRYAESAWPRERNSAALPTHRIDKPEFGFYQIMKTDNCVLSARSIRRILATS